jgi:hypothetical protein
LDANKNNDAEDRLGTYEITNGHKDIEKRRGQDLLDDFFHIFFLAKIRLEIDALVAFNDPPRIMEMDEDGAHGPA